MGRSNLILVDTHIAVWLASDYARLSRNARQAIDEARKEADGLAISDMSLLELVMLSEKNRIALTVTLENFLSEMETRFVVMPITARACVRALSFPATFPKDPADRIIAATALVEGLALITADREIRRAGVVRTIW